MKEKEAVSAQAAVYEMSPEQCVFPSRCSGSTQSWDERAGTSLQSQTVLGCSGERL